MPVALACGSSSTRTVDDPACRLSPYAAPEDRRSASTRAEAPTFVVSTVAAALEVPVLVHLGG